MSCLTLCDSKDWSTPDSSVLHYLPEFAQIHVYWFGDVVYPSNHLHQHQKKDKYLNINPKQYGQDLDKENSKISMKNLRTKYVLSCILSLCDPMDYSPQGSSVHEIFLTRILEQVTIIYSRGIFQPRDGTCVLGISCTGKWILYHGATWEAQELNKQIAIPGSDRKTQNCQDVSPILVHRFNTFPVDCIRSNFYISKTGAKVDLEGKRSRIGKTIFKNKNKIRRLIISEFKICFNMSIAIKTMIVTKKIDN